MGRKCQQAFQLLRCRYAPRVDWLPNIAFLRKAGTFGGDFTYTAPGLTGAITRIASRPPVQRNWNAPGGMTLDVPPCLAIAYFSVAQQFSGHQDSGVQALEQNR